MAHCEPIHDVPGKGDNLTVCGICLSEIEKPKALPCLHSFCLECLRKICHQSGFLICPLCKEHTPLPPDGVDGFKDNHFIVKLQERKNLYESQKDMQCTCCGKNNQVFARCTDCNGFICQACIDLHKNIAPLKVHTVVDIDDLKSGKVDISKVVKEECCQQHIDQPLEFFCNTCNISICHACTIVEHSRPEHDSITLENASENRKAEIEKLLENCAEVANKIDNAAKQAEKVKGDLKVALEEANRMLEESKEKAKIDLLKSLEDHYKSTSERLSNIDTETCKKIATNQAVLENVRAKLSNAMKIANQVVNSGFKQDVTCNYNILSDTLKSLQEIEVVSVEDDLGEVKFIARVERHGVKPLGKIQLKKGTIEIVLGGKGSARGIAAGLNGDIAVTDSNAEQVKVYNGDGDLKFALDTKRGLQPGETSYPWDVIINTKGQYFVTDGTAYVKVYSHEGMYLNQFPVKTPDGTLSDRDNSALCGLAIDHEGHLLVGSSTYYISRHRQDGTAVSSIKTDIHPWFVAVTSRGRIVVSSASSNLGVLGVQVMNPDGNILHTIDASYSQYVKSWCPEGVCCTADDVIYISSWDSGNNGGVYSFTEKGEYLGCVTTDVTYAHGIALTGSKNKKLVVAQGNGNPVKIIPIKCNP